MPPLSSQSALGNALVHGTSLDIPRDCVPAAWIKQAWRMQEPAGEQFGFGAERIRKAELKVVLHGEGQAFEVNA